MADLITLARAKQAIPNTTTADDAKIQTLITAASRAIEVWCRRKVPSASYDQKLSGDRSGSLWLDQYPVTAVARVAVARNPGLYLQNSDSATNQRATAQVTNTGLTLTRVASGAVASDSSVTWASNATVQAVANAVSALSGGWAAEAVARFKLWPSSDLVPIQGALNCLGVRVGLALYDEELTDFILDEATGELRGSIPRGFMIVRVQYTAGYSTVPEDVQEACARLVADWFGESNRTGGLEMERIGDYSYRVPSASATLPDDVAGLLAPYRDRRL